MRFTEGLFCFITRILASLPGVLSIEVIERLEGHIGVSLLLLQEGALPVLCVTLELKAALKLLFALACPVFVVEFTVPGFLFFIIICWHNHLPFILARRA